MPAVQTTKLIAVNQMLAIIGERPVNSLGTTQRLDVLRAVSVLNEVNVMVQSRGWWFNSEVEVDLSPNADGEYDIPANVVKIDPWNDTVWEFVQRGTRLYNREDRTFIGNTADLKVNWVVLLDFEDCPQTFKHYVAARAAVIYQARTIGSPTLNQFAEQQAQEAWALLQQEECDAEDINLTYSPGISKAVYNR
jgi:hypothetical protein